MGKRTLLSAIFGLAVLAALLGAVAYIFGPSGSSEVSAQSAHELSELCANRYNGDLRDGMRGCASTETRIKIPDDYPFTMCANRYNGDLRYSRFGRCASTETAIQMPDAGIVPVCVNRYNLELRYSRTGRCASTESSAVIAGNQAPVANDDGRYVTQLNVDLQIATSDPNDLLDNDELGLPSGEISSFGGGSLGGSVADNNAGASVALAGGTLTVNADGSFSLVNPSTAGDYTFDYQITNIAGSSEATVAIQVQEAPQAADDSPAADSQPGDLFHTALDTMLDSALSAVDDNLLSNDSLGFPGGTISTFGGGDLGGTVTDNAAGSIASPLPTFTDGSLTVNADGSFVFTPPDGFVGTFSFDYRLTNPAGSSDGTITIAIGERPEATSDSYTPTVLGNVSIDTTESTSFTVLSNDLGDGIAITASDTTSTEGGDVTVNTDGTFTYNPPPGYEGIDSFTYTIDNDFNDPQLGTVSLTVAGTIWFVDSSATTNGDGRFDSPFNCLVDTDCLDDAPHGNGDTIFLHDGTYTAGLTLLDNQFVIGEGASSSITAISGLNPPADSPTLPDTGGAKPILVTTDATAITLGADNGLHGFRIGNTGTASGISGTNFGTLAINDFRFSGTGQTLDLVNGTANVTLESLVASTSSADGLRLNNVGGSFTVTGATTLSSTAGDGIDLDTISAAVTFDSVSINAVTGDGLRIVSSTSGQTDFAGAVTLNTAGSTAANMDSNTGHTIRFSGGLDIDTTSGTGLNATGGGTVEVLNTTAINTIDATTGAAVNIQNTTIGAQGVTFQSISSSGGSSAGIFLQNTGAAGSLSVTGTGSAGSGGTISSKTGANGSTQGIGIYLESTSAPSFNHMQLNDFDNYAIRGSSVAGFTLADSTIDGTNGTSEDDDEGSVRFTELTGTATISDSTIEGGHKDNVFLTNTTGVLNLALSGTTIGLNGTTNGNDGILIESEGSADVTFSVTDSNFLGARGDMLQVNTLGTASSDITIQDNTFNNTHSNIVSGGGGITLSGGSLTSDITVTYDISGQDTTQIFQGAMGNAVVANFVEGAGAVNGTIQNNVIGVQGNSGSGSQQGSGIVVGASGTLTHSTTISDNTVQEVAANLAGIEVIGNGDSTMNANLLNNAISDLDPAFPFAGIYTLAGGATTSDTASICVDIENNTVDAGSTGAYTIFTDQISASASYNFPGFGGGDLNAFLAGQNTLSPSGAVDTSFAQNVTGNGTTCVQ